MLPPALAQLKATLIRKGYSARSEGEDQLLEELEALDADPDVRRGVERKSFRETRITAGPGSCPCCGR